MGHPDAASIRDPVCGITVDPIGGKHRGAHAVIRRLRFSRATMRNLRENLFFAFVFDALAVPIAAGVLYPVLGLLLNPMIARPQ